jgi:hypothetical protein
MGLGPELASRAMTAPHTFHADDTCMIALWHNLAIVDCGGDMAVDRMRRVGLAYRALALNYPQAVVGLALVRPETPVASADARAEITHFMRELGDSLQHVAVVVEARGVLAQVMCSVIRGINVIARSSRLSVTTDLDGAVELLSPLLRPRGAGGVDGRDLRAAVDEVRAAFRPQPHAQSG